MAEENNNNVSALLPVNEGQNESIVPTQSPTESENKIEESLVINEDGTSEFRQKDVFDELEIQLKSTKHLVELEKQRSICPKCKKSKKYFCYDCLIPFGEPPNVSLPVSVDMFVYSPKYSLHSLYSLFQIILRQKLK